MLSRFIATALLSLTPILLACGTNSTANLVMGEDETALMLAICEHTDVLTIPDCEDLVAQLTVGEAVIVKDSWFNSDLAEDLSYWALEEWYDISGGGFIVNRIVPSPEPGQWVIEVWLQQGEELLPIETVFPRFSEEFWVILEYSLYGQLLDYNSDALQTSKRVPIDWQAMNDEHRQALAASPVRQTLLELFEGNQIVVTGAIDVIPIPPRRGCSESLEAVFGEVEQAE